MIFDERLNIYIFGIFYWNFFKSKITINEIWWIFGILSKETKIKFLFFIDLLCTLFYRQWSFARTMRYSMSYWIYLIFFIGIFSKEKNKITINEIQWYSTDIYLVFFIEILSREESKIIIKFLFTILSSIYYVINTILSSMIVCKKNEVFDERLDIHPWFNRTYVN